MRTNLLLWSFCTQTLLYMKVSLVISTGGRKESKKPSRVQRARLVSPGLVFLCRPDPADFLTSVCALHVCDSLLPGYTRHTASCRSLSASGRRNRFRILFIRFSATETWTVASLGSEGTRRNRAVSSRKPVRGLHDTIWRLCFCKTIFFCLILKSQVGQNSCQHINWLFHLHYS